MEKIAFGDTTVGDLLVWIGIAIGVLAVLGMLSKLFRKQPKSEVLQQVRCDGCGWQGQVSRIAGRCPRCNQPLGDRKAGR
ncbi:MAG: hypothetical protein JXR96_05605 [Deltaproteobacteria bacterium]|nr:hypothetical protein [Deltaproteobacteria bacterium]